MQRTVAMPKLGMTMTEGVLVRWHVQEGDAVAKDDVLADIETDKVELELEAPYDGRVARLIAAPGQTMPVGEPVLLIETDADAPQQSAPPVTDVTDTSSASEAMASGTASSAEEAVEHARAVQTSVATAPTSPTSPTRVPSTPAAKRIARERSLDLAAVAQTVTPDGVRPLCAADVLAAAEMLPTVAGSAAPTLTPLARKLAAEHAVTAEELAAILPDGAAQRAGRQAVEQALAARRTVQHKGANAPTASVETVAQPGANDVHEPADDFVPLTSMRRTIAERTAHSFATAPHIYLDIEVDMTEAEALREAHARAAERRGERAPTATALLLRVAGAALARHPEVNASYVPANAGQPAGILRKREVNIGVAVAVPEGLLVPVVRNADRKTLAELAAELADLAQRARSGGLKPDDLADGTFSISNLGMYGIDTFHAVLPEPQSAILAVGRTQRRPTVVADGHGGEIVAIRSILKLSLSADHRVLDGAIGARFLETLRTLLEEPRLLV